MAELDRYSGRRYFDEHTRVSLIQNMGEDSKNKIELFKKQYFVEPSWISYKDYIFRKTGETHTVFKYISN